MWDDFHKKRRNHGPQMFAAMIQRVWNYVMLPDAQEGKRGLAPHGGLLRLLTNRRSENSNVGYSPASLRSAPSRISTRFP
jgi:hypothetical protein